MTTLATAPCPNPSSSITKNVAGLSKHREICKTYPLMPNILEIKRDKLKELDKRKSSPGNEQMIAGQIASNTHQIKSK